ncbi:hypothetical protein D3C85_1504560 [compost metagenome]
MMLISGLLVSPICTRATPINTDSRITCSIEPLANASMNVLGMMLRKKSTVPPCSWATWAYLPIAPASRVVVLMFMPTPGFITLTTIRPMTRAMVERISK